MKKCNLNTWTKGWYGFHPCNWWNNIKHFFREIKWSYQRITKGYSDWDVWDLDHYYEDLICNTLVSLKETTHGFPIDMTEEEWSRWLERTAECFYNGNEANDEVYENRYRKDAEKLFDKWTSELNENGLCKLCTNYTPEDEALDKKYLDRENEIEQIRKQEIKEGLSRLADRWGDLWD